GYDARGNLLWEEDPLGRKDRYTWDSLGRLVSTRDGENTGVDYRYDEVGNRTEETQTGGEPYRYRYDSLGRLKLEINRLGDEKRYRYYRNGQLKSIVDFNGSETRFSYDEAGRLAEKQFADGSSEGYRYDRKGNLLAALNPAAQLEYRYDSLGRLTSSTDLLKDQSISYRYDAAGNRTSLTWADGNRTANWSYNELNLLVAMTDAEGDVTRFSYDELGRETERTLANGITKVTGYDEAGRISSIRHSGGKPNEALPARFYAYNDAGQKLLQLDELGRLTSRQYDQAGRLSEASYAFAGGKSVTDFWERIYLGIIPEKLKAGEAQEEEDLLTAELESLAEQNPLLGELGFSSSDYLERLDESYLELAEVFPELKNHRLSAAARPKHNFAFKANWGHLHKRLPEELKSWFRPGKIGELLEQPQWTERFAYDLRGNITEKSNGWGEIDYTYNAENRLTKAGEREYRWDENGNLIGEQLGEMQAAYRYDGENRLTELSSTARGFIARPGSPLEMGILYSYDALGRRVSREQIKDMQNGSYRDRFASSGERMSYLYDGLSFKVLAEGRDAAGLDATGGWHGRSGRQFKPTSEYLRTGSRLITRTDVTTEGHSLLEPWLGGYHGKMSYLQDEQGSVIGELDKRGRLSARYRYDAFGALTEGRFDGTGRLGYNGKRVDGYSGRYDYGYRDYEPLTMRWTTVDPVKDGVNWYVYVGNDPINFVDLLGLLKGNNLEFLSTQQNLVGTDYVWAGNDPETDGGVDCSGAIICGLNEIDNNVSDQTADEIYDNLTVTVVGNLKPGDLRFLDSNNDGIYEHVQTISSYDGDRINASGGPENTLEDPGIVEELPGPLPISGEIRRLSWDEDYEENIRRHDPDCNY
ncbi:MAG: hypothetical protein K9L66_08830, partial [Spirochaetaceae bacterium]|nr:hypothetical protein [Spirochaetaceae bacterium]MCF7951616.1 hypothetical protein [Spirochaetaceae bacterium]